jgi:hypothetical protein
MKPVSRTAVAALAYCVLCTSAAAQFTVTNIAGAKRDDDANYYPDDTVTLYRVRGRVTSSHFSTNRTDFYIQDTNDNIGIQVFSAAFVADTNTFVLGVEAEVTDRISQTNGLRFISPQFSGRLTVTDPTAVTVTPVRMTIAGLLAAAESNEARLVSVTNVMVGTNWPAWGSSASLVITDSTATLILRIDSDTNLDGQPGPTNAFDVVGLFIQFDAGATPTGGYQVLPRSYADLVQAVGPQPPSVFVFNTNVTGTANAPLNIRVLGQDRNAADTVTLSNTVAPVGSSFTDYGNREGRFDWTPGTGDQNTTNQVVFVVSDAISAATAVVQVLVRAASGGPGYAWINEFHYDNGGADTNEGVEMAGQAGIDLSSYYIITYNGGDGLIDTSNACSGVIDDEGNGYGAVWFAIAGIQNGSPDGIALCHVTNGLLQFLGYEGIFTAANGPAAGIASVDVGVYEAGTESVGLSLQLQGSGTNYEAFTWTGPMAASPGDLNGAGQIVVGPVDAKVTHSGLRLSPVSPTTNDAFDVVCVIIPNYSASNLVSTAWYQINSGGWSSIAMSDTGGYTNKTTSQIAAQTNGAVVDYYVNTVFDGPGTNSPMGSVTNTHTIRTFPPTIGSLSNQLVQVSNELAFAVGATEPDGDLIDLTASNVPANAAFYPTNGVSASAGGFVFTPDETQGGTVLTTSFYAVDKEGVVSTAVVIRVIPRGYFVDFEGVGETKTGYAPADVVLSGMNWNMYSNLIGTSAADVKNGLRSARFRYDGSMTMLEDKANGCGTVSLKHARYGTDSISTGRVEYSTDQGTNWIQAGTDFVATSISNFTDFSAAVNQSGNVRIRIRKLALASNSARLNVDDILITDYAGGTDADADGMPDWWETLYFTNTAQTGTNDYDYDFLSNLEEYLADTVPTASNSFFALEGILQRTNRFISFFSSTARVYTFQFNADPRIGDAWSNLQTDVPGIGALMSLSDTNAATSRLYRIRVRPP